MEPKTELQKNAIAEARRKELETYQRALDIQWLNSRMDDSCIGRHLARIKQEAELEKDFQERTDHAAIVNAKTEKEIALATEIAKQSREEACELLRRHYLREHDPELRELIRKLQAGYVCRDQRQQILHNEYRRLQNKVEENHANRILSDALYSDLEAKEKEDKEMMERKLQYCKELQQQLVNKQREKQCQFEDTLIEKKMLEDVMRTIADEDQRELQQKREQTEKLRKEVETFKQAREAWKQKQKELLVQEERRIEQQGKAASDRSQAIVAERERKLQLKEKLNEKVVAKILIEEESRREREEVIRMLQEQEYLEKGIQEDIAERDKTESTKKQTKEVLTQQMETKQRLEKEQKEREANYRKLMESQISSTEQKEKEDQLKQKEKKRQYCLELQQQIEENARRRMKENELEENRAKHVFDYNKDWSTEVTEERKKIVEEHAPHLLGYLQPGVLGQQDLPAIKSGVQKDPRLAQLDIESMAVSKKPLRFPKCNPQCKVLKHY
ncbi:unnamed protein product [Parnassius apollo]|uniref:Meiosis-specific nuclear structural protein 1 n=1 Tax=Parnassius apollo TaxID=110799 RepID=A0A8S3XU00_PARAO|nr:unnamed protein product [Parnassius apollo]